MEKTEIEQKMKVVLGEKVDTSTLPVEPWQPTIQSKNEVVMAEFKLTGGELHKIATGNCMQLNDNDSPFSIRFLLKSSYKVGTGSYVMNHFVLQVVATEKKSFMKKEDIGTRVKVVKTESKKEKKQKQKVKTVINDEGESLF